MKAPITAILFWIGTAIAAFLAFKFFSWNFNTLAFTALIIAAVFFLIGLKAYRIHKALNPKPTTQAPNNEQNVEQKSKPAAAAEADENTAQEAAEETAVPAEPVKRPSPYEYRTYTVKGVTFKTGVSGRKSRQSILRAIHFEDPPFDEPYEIVPKVYDYEGEPAVGLYVNGDEHEQIGNLPKEAAAEIAGMMDRYIDSDIEVYGGGDHNWGAEITLRFKKEE